MRSAGGQPVTSTANTAPASNVAAGGDISALATLINNINLAGQKAANVSRIPGEAALEKKSSANIADELAGKVPSDVIRLLDQLGAERGTRMGAPDSPNVDASYLRALGLTSLDLTGKGQSELSAATARNPGAPLFNPAGQLLTPGEDLQNKLEQERLALEQERLFLQSLGRGGGGGGGRGYGAPGTSESLVGAYDAPVPVGGYVPSFADLTGATGGTAFGSDPYAAWNQWAAGLNLGGGGGTSTGNTFEGDMYGDQFTGYA